MDDGTRIKEEHRIFLTAVKDGDVKKVEALLKADAKLISCEEMAGVGALHLAAVGGNAAMLDFILSHKDKGLNLNHQNIDGNTALMLAARAQRNAALGSMVAAGCDVNFKGKGGATAAHQAAGMGHADTLRVLKELGAEFDATPSEGGSVLHWACHHTTPAAIGVLLYDCDMPIDCEDAHGGTPIFTAVFAKRPDSVSCLLEHGANANAVCKGDGSTVLMTAVEHGTLADVKQLLAYGADVTPKNKEGKTALQLAEGKSAILKELQKPAVDPKKREEDATRFKTQGNKVFAEGESVKAAKFYTLAITLQPTNHVFFSNRSACNFNTQNFDLAYADACRCIKLNPGFARGYFRKASTLKTLEQYKQAALVVEEGLTLDTQSSDLHNLKKDLVRALRDEKK